MPFVIATVLAANEVFSPLGEIDPGQLITDMGDADTVKGIGDALHLFDVLPTEDAQALKDFLDTVPKSLDAAMVAGLKNAIGRGVKVQLSWKPGYDFELQAWEVSQDSAGLANLNLVAPHPIEPERS